MTYYDDRYRYAPPPPAYAQQPYVDPRAYIPGARQTDLARRRDGSNDSVVEEVQRDFPPGQYDYGYAPRRTTRVTMVREVPRRARSVGGPRGPSYYYDDGGYDQRPRRSRRRDDRGDRRSRYSSSSASSSPSRSPSPRRRRRKSLGEQALAAVGLGGVVGAEAAKRRSRSRHRRSYSYSPSPTRNRSRRRARSRSQQRIAQAVKAALAAGAVEAIRVRKEPGPWTGDKGKRVLTAAIASAGTDGLIDRNPDKHETLKIVESTIAGLAANRLVNGARNSHSGSRGRSQSRGRGGGGGGGGAGGSGSTLKDLAAGGLLAAAGKEIYDHVRSRSRSRSRRRGRSSSRDSDGSESYARGSKKRSKSVSDYLSKGLAAVGLGEAADRVSDHGRRRRRRDGQPSRYSDYSDDEYYDDRDGYGGDYYRDGGTAREYYAGGGGSRRDRDSRSVGRYRSSSDVGSPFPAAYGSDSRSAGPRGGGDRGRKGPRGGSGSSSGSSSSDNDCDSDLGDSSDEKQRRKKMRRDVMLTTGLATVATIHAAHSVYSNMEKRKARHQQLKEGDMSPEEARKARIKANLADAASVGLAALGIKGAIGEWKEAKEKMHEHETFKAECEKKKLMREKRRSKSVGAGGSRRNNNDDDGDYYRYHDGNPYGYYDQDRGPMMNAPRISN